MADNIDLAPKALAEYEAHGATVRTAHLLYEALTAERAARQNIERERDHLRDVTLPEAEAERAEYAEACQTLLANSGDQRSRAEAAEAEAADWKVKFYAEQRQNEVGRNQLAFVQRRLEEAENLLLHIAGLAERRIEPA